MKSYVPLSVALVCAFLALLHSDPSQSTPRCDGTLLRSEISERQEATLAVVRAKKYAALQRRMDGFLAAYVVGKITDEELFYEFGAFDRWGPWLTPILQEWVERYPRSFAAHHAMSLHVSSIAWQIRGTALARDTSVQQMSEFTERLRSARGWSLRSIPLHTKPILAYQQLMANAKAITFDVQLTASSTAVQATKLAEIPRPDVVPILQESIRIQPDNTIVRNAYVWVLAPRWGGSFEALREYAKPSTHSDLPADRRASVSYEATMQIASDFWFLERLDEAVSTYEMASRICRLNGPFISIGQIRLEQRRFEDALRAGDAALALVPGSAEANRVRAPALRGLGRHAEAVALLRNLTSEGWPDVQYLLGEYYLTGTGGVTVDRAEARRLFGIAAKTGYEPALKRLQSLSGQK